MIFELLHMLLRNKDLSFKNFFAINHSVGSRYNSPFFFYDDSILFYERNVGKARYVVEVFEVVINLLGSFF